MKIVFFGNAPEKIAAIRYRVIKFAAMLEADGHPCVVCLPASVGQREALWDQGNRLTKLAYLFLVFLRRCGQLRHVAGADVVYFRGPVFEYGPPFFEHIIRLLNKNLVFDIDDAIWERPAHVDSPFVRFMDFEWVRKMCGLCKHAVVGNQHLADYVGQYLSSVSIVPTCIDMDKHGLRGYDKGGDVVVLGWTGLKDNLGYMEPIEGVLQDLAQQYDIKIHVATGRPYKLDGVTVENEYWTMDREIDYLQNADIGLMPLHDSPRARGKCAFKALQYMAVGVAPVISPVGMNAEVIEDGVNGFLADTPAEWREKLTLLIQDAALRERMGRAARETVIQRYSHEANYPVLKAALLSVAGEQDA